MNRSIALACLKLAVVLSVALSGSRAHAETHPIWNPGLAQAATGALGTGNAPKDEAALKALVSSYLSLSDSQLKAKISTTRGGASDDKQRYALAQATYNLALLYHLTKNTDYAHRSGVLLKRYADVFPGWSYDTCHTIPCGVWTDWYHNDFDVSMLLALAYDLLAPAGVIDANKTAIRQFLVQVVQRDLEYRLYTFNWAFYRPLGLVIYGRVLDDPKLAHLGYWFYAKHVHEYYAQDGFLTEGTYSYHRQMTPRFLDERQAYYMNGYSDPSGYKHVPLDTRWDATRIDNFDFQQTYADAATRMLDSLNKTTLPNGEYPILNDTKQYDNVYGDPPDASQLLGGIGHAILAGGSGKDQTQARLDFSYTVGHRHRDALHLIYFGDGTETVGGTAYRYPDASWNTSTLSHNLVAIDGAEQKGSYFVDWTMSPYVPGKVSGGTVQRNLWSQDNENLHNNVLLWEPSFAGFDAVQVADVDATDAYRDHADRYRRLLVLVRVSGDDYYLADLFRVRGGTQHDWLLHGGHKDNQLKLTESLSAASGSLGQIKFQQSATTDKPWEASFVHGATTGRVMMAGAPGTTLYAAKAPRYEYGGEQDHLVVRRKATATTEDVFLAAHETFTSSPHVTAVDELGFGAAPGTAIGMQVTLADGSVDYIVQTLDDGPTYPAHTADGVELEVAGRFAHVRVKNDQVVWMYLVQGSKLRFGSDTLDADGADFSHRGDVTAVERRESGATENAFVLDAPLPGDAIRWAGKTIIVSYGNGWTWAYRIERVEGSRVITKDEPGFELDSKGVDRQYFPLQENLGLERFAGPVTFLVPGSALRDEAGNVHTTLDAPGTVDGGAGSGGTGSGGTGSGASTGAGGSGANSGAADDSEGGCGCDLPRSTPNSPAMPLLMLAALMALRRTRRT